MIFVYVAKNQNLSAPNDVTERLNANACMVLNIQKDRADALVIKDIAKSFVKDLPECVTYFGRCE